MSLRSVSKISRSVNRGFYTTCKKASELHNESSGTLGQDKKKTGQEKTSVMPEEPTHCCMTGCPNCVWIKYAQDLAQMFEDGDKIAKQKISEKVHDPNLRAFLFTQLGLIETGSKTD